MERESVNDLTGSTEKTQPVCHNLQSAGIEPVKGFEIGSSLEHGGPHMSSCLSADMSHSALKSSWPVSRGPLERGRGARGRPDMGAIGNRIRPALRRRAGSTELQTCNKRGCAGRPRTVIPDVASLCIDQRVQTWLQSSRPSFWSWPLNTNAPCQCSTSPQRERVLLRLFN